jgi:hypothetical protein
LSETLAGIAVVVAPDLPSPDLEYSRRPGPTLALHSHPQ